MSRCTPLIAAVLICVAAAASGQELQAGRDYTEIVPHQPTTDPQRVVVTEFFSYLCPHCFSFNPSLTAWVHTLEKDVLFEQVAVVFGRQPWQKPAQVYYALKTIGKAEELTPAVFKALHVDLVDWQRDAEIVDWFAAHGVDREQFAAAFNRSELRFVRRAGRPDRDGAQGARRADTGRRRQVRRCDRRPSRLRPAARDRRPPDREGSRGQGAVTNLPSAIFAPFFAMLFLTLAVWVYLYARPSRSSTRWSDPAGSREAG